jgi:hypothetical protein
MTEGSSKFRVSMNNFDSLERNATLATPCNPNTPTSSMKGNSSMYCSYGDKEEEEEREEVATTGSVLGLIPETSNSDDDDDDDAELSIMLLLLLVDVARLTLRGVIASEETLARGVTPWKLLLRTKKKLPSSLGIR